MGVDRSDRLIRRFRVSILAVLFPWSLKIPVTDSRVERPKSGVFCPSSMLDGDPDFGCLCAFDLGVKEPNLFDLDVGLVKISTEGVPRRTGSVKSGDTKLSIVT